MIQKKSEFTLACFAAGASILGCLAISIATMPHPQVATPRFHASKIAEQRFPSREVITPASVVISK